MGFGTETESKNGNRFREFLDENNMCAINTFVGDGSKTWYGNGTGKHSSKRLHLLSQIFAPFCCVVSRPG